MKIKYMLKQKSISSMNARGILLCLAALPALCGCFAKETPVCDIEVSTERETYAVGESVVFNFSGKADNIVFYSGEPGHSLTTTSGFSYRQTSTGSLTQKTSVRPSGLTSPTASASRRREDS